MCTAVSDLKRWRQRCVELVLHGTEGSAQRLSLLIAVVTGTHFLLPIVLSQTVIKLDLCLGVLQIPY